MEINANDDFRIGEARIATDADFLHLKDLCEQHEGWNRDYYKKPISVWTKCNATSDFKMIKICSTFKDIAASTVYDVLMDAEYRFKWDHYMLESFDICALNPNNDVGYYSLKSPKPLKNRDFVMQRSWLDRGNEFYIVNHSVNHKSEPPRKGIIRAISYITGYHILCLSSHSCQITYLTQADPKGKLPSWIVNKLTQFTAPKMMSRIHKACKSYIEWKSSHSSRYFKPWLNPEQITLPRLSRDDIASINDLECSSTIDETSIAENDLDKDDIDD